MNTMLDSKHQSRLLKKWAPILESGSKIESDSTKLALAQVLENTRNDFARRGLLGEATCCDHVGSDRKSALGDVDVKRGVMTSVEGDPFKNGDAFLPNVVMPMLRRIFPDLIANELVGVQPLNGPIGFALALRAKYNNDGLVGVEGPYDPSAEIGFDPVDTAYAGMSSDAGLTALTGYADEPLASRWNGVGADVKPETEFASLHDHTYPTVGFELIKSGVEAKTRKLAAHWSNELAEDMEAMHGIDVEAEMVNILSYEIGAEIDRQIVTEMVKAAITGGSVSTWTPVSADGLDQMGRLATLLTQITIEANNIAIRTRRGAGNFVVASPKVCALLEQLSMNKFVSFAGGKSIPSVPYTGMGALQKQGLVNDGQQLLVRDAYAQKDYVLIGYKGAHPGDSGIIYCPYIPVQLVKAMQPDSFTPSVGARTRYGVMNTPWDAKNYYHFMKVDGLTKSYTWDGSRQFIAKDTLSK